MFRAGLAVGVSVGVMLMLAGCASDGGGKPSTSAHALTIKGALVYRERLALPPDSAAVVDLRDTSLASRGRGGGTARNVSGQAGADSV